MLNFSNKAAKRFRIKWSELEERSGDFWKVDVEMFERVPMLFIVHEYTLYTLVRRKSQLKTPQDIAAEIKRYCPWYRYAGRPTLGKNGNKRLVGSINQMRRETWAMCSPDEINAVEMHINNGLFSYIAVEKRDYGKPFEAVDNYIKGRMPWLQKEGE
jgi:hypothetical protein